VLPDLEDPITSDAITADYRILQRKLGHRYSLDDVATAWEAVHARPHAARAIDLGTGIGSVLLMVAWKLQHARMEAIEAQEVSFRLLAQNIANNGLTDRVRIHHGDLRDRLPFAEKADLVTGTPPYLPPGTATEALDGQRAHARIELRGGVEAYCLAAASCLASGGAFVICADARTPERTEAAGRAAGLHPRAKRDVIPRAGKAALFTLHTFVRAEERPENSAIEVLDPVYVRDAKSELTEQSYALRETFGLGRRARQPQES
jgi:tRNA1(Val) A37 N6-methylase TrmN6